MPITSKKITAFTKKVADLADTPVVSTAELKAQFDSSPEELRQALNGLIDILLQTTAGDGGSHNIGSAAISGVTGSTVYDQLVNLKSQINQAAVGAIPDGSLGEVKLDGTLITKINGKLDALQTLPSVNLGYAGITATVPIDSATTVAVGDVLYMSSTGYKKAKGDAAATMPCTVLALEAGTGGNKKVLLFGYFKNTAYNNTVGARAYVDIASAGAITTTQPSATGNQIQDLGCFVVNDTLFFNPNAAFIEK